MLHFIRNKNNHDHNSPISLAGMVEMLVYAELAPSSNCFFHHSAGPAGLWQKKQGNGLAWINLTVDTLPKPSSLKPSEHLAMFQAGRGCTNIYFLRTIQVVLNLSWSTSLSIRVPESCLSNIPIKILNTYQILKYMIDINGHLNIKITIDITLINRHWAIIYSNISIDI